MGVRRSRGVQPVARRAGRATLWKVRTKLRLSVVVTILVGLVFGAPAGALAGPGAAGHPVALPGLQHAVRVVRDRVGVPHVYARNDHDLFFVNGYLQAQDRFFEMDLARRQAGGARAELLGPGTGDQELFFDVIVRTVGLRRAAERSAAAYPSWVMADLRAYAAGVNLWLARNPLPAEYGALELTKASVPPWTPVDSIVIFKFVTAELSLFADFQELSNTDLLMAYEGAGQARGFDGTKLYFEDVARSEPFDSAVSIPPAATSAAAGSQPGSRAARPALRSKQVAAVSELVRRSRELGLGRPSASGSNWWVVSGAKSATGFPLLAGDPHLPLPSPPFWHEIGLNVAGSRDDDDRLRGGQDTAMNVYGTGVPGVPGVVHGFNDHLMWSSTTNPLDVSDFFGSASSSRAASRWRRSTRALRSPW